MPDREQDDTLTTRLCFVSELLNVDFSMPDLPPTSSASAANHEAESSALRKAAVLIASLPLEEATHLTRSLGKERLERLANAIAYVHDVREKEQRGIARELADSRHTPQVPLTEAASATRKSGKAIDQADPAVVAMVLRHELPQTVAVVLSRMAPAAAARVLRRLSTDRQLTVVKRMATLQPGDESTISNLLTIVSQSVGPVSYTHLTLPTKA